MDSCSSKNSIDCSRRSNLKNNPYLTQASTAFWSRSVSRNFSADSLWSRDSQRSFFAKNDLIVSAGSCFASNLIPWIEKVGLEYVRTEELPFQFKKLPENLGYRNFSAAYGNIYTARHLLQLYQQALGLRVPVEDRWYVDGMVVDPFRPGMAYPAASDAEFDMLKASHLKSVRKAFNKASVFVFTLGLSEAWHSKVDGSVFPACPGTISGEFDEAIHEFKNFSVEEIVDDLTKFIELLRETNPQVRFIITVSPVPLVATATKSHVLLASTYSKAVLRVAAERVCSQLDDVSYFPAFEIITGPQAPFDYFESDRRNVSEIGVTAVMNSLFRELVTREIDTSNISEPSPYASHGQLMSDISQQIAKAECDEVMLDVDLQ